MEEDPASVVYLVLAVVPLVVLVALLVPLIPRRGVWFRTTPTRDQGMLVGLFGFTILMSAFAVRSPAFVVFMALSSAVFVYQSWGPKRWSGGWVYGAYPFPLRVKGWAEGDQVRVRLGCGIHLAVPVTPGNQGFLADLRSRSDSGEGMDIE